MANPLKGKWVRIRTGEHAGEFGEAIGSHEAGTVDVRLESGKRVNRIPNEQVEEIKHMRTKAATTLGSQPDKTGRERESISNSTLANSVGGTEEKYMRTKDFGVEEGHEPHDEAVHEELGLPGDATPEGGMDDVEPWGAQILRRKYIEHGDHLRDHEDMLRPLEDESVRKHLEDEQEWHAGQMAKIEKLFQTHKRYKDLPPLAHPDDEMEDEVKDIGDEDMDADLDMDDYETKDEDLEAGDPDLEEGVEEEDEGQGDMDTLEDEGVAEGDNPIRDEEEPTAEEVIEGMEVGNKDLAPAPKAGIRGFKEEAQKDTTKTVRSAGTKHMCGSCTKAYEDAEANGEEVDEKALCNKCAKDFPEMDEADGQAEVQEGKAMDPDDFDEDEKKALRKAIKFLKSISEEDSEWGDDARMNSFHYHKSIDELGGEDEEAQTKAMDDDKPLDEVGEKAFDDEGNLKEEATKAFDDEDGLEQKDLAPAPKADVPGFKEDKQEDSTAKVSSAGTKALDDEEDKPVESEAKAMKRSLVKGVSKFLKRLSSTKDFGAGDRELASAAAKAMEDIVGEEDEKDLPDDELEEKAMDDEGGDAPYEPGEMGEKAADDDDFVDVEDESFDDGEMEKRKYLRYKRLKRLRVKALEDGDEDEVKSLTKAIKDLDMEEDRVEKAARSLVKKSRKALGQADGSLVKKKGKGIKSEPYTPEWEEEERQEHEHMGKAMRKVVYSPGKNPRGQKVEVIDDGTELLLLVGGKQVLESDHSDAGMMRKEADRLLNVDQEIKKLKTKDIDKDEDEVDEKALTELKKAQELQQKAIQQFKKQMEALRKGFIFGN